jgi:hypothetical protein
VADSLPNLGFDPAESAYHFVVLINEDKVTIEERFSVEDEVQPAFAPQLRAVIDSYRWNRLNEVVQSHFNRRLQDAKRKTAKFGQGEHLLAPHLGKELTLLAWATEGLDPTDLPNAIANWLGLAPEERWWLYLMVKSSSAGIEPIANPRGWRKAIRIAFGESPAPAPADARHATDTSNDKLIIEEESVTTKRKKLVTVTKSLFDEISE